MQKLCSFKVETLYQAGLLLVVQGLFSSLVRGFYSERIKLCTPRVAVSDQLRSRARRESFSESWSIKPKSDFIHHFLIDLEPNRISFGSKYIGKW